MRKSVREIFCVLSCVSRIVYEYSISLFFLRAFVRASASELTPSLPLAWFSVVACGGQSRFGTLSWAAAAASASCSFTLGERR